MSERYQREIEELLRRLDGRPRPETFSRRFSRRTARFRAGFQSAFRGFLRRPVVEQFMIASVVLLLAWLVLQLFQVSLGGLAYWISVLSLLFFLFAIGLSIAQRRPRSGSSSSGPSDRYWRGQVIEYRPRKQSFWARVRRWLRLGR